MKMTHYVRVTPEVWVSFNQEPEMILDWLLHMHEQNRDRDEALTLSNIEPFKEVLSQIEVYIDGADTYNMEMALVGEELIVNEAQAVVVGILTPQLLHIVKDTLHAFKRDDVKDMAFVASDQFEDIWQSWTQLQQFCDTASDQEELVLIYYE